MVFTIYALIDPRDCLPYYVGCTANPKHRYADHCAGYSTCGAKPRNKELRKLGLKPGFIALRTAGDSYSAAMAEAQAIADLRSRGHKLTNQRTKATFKGLRSY